MAGTANINSTEERMGACAPILQVRNLSKAFGAMMAVNLVNDGPVTIVIESPQKAQAHD